MAAENCLWGAPRIHGELLKLGFAISERTVSRYLRGRPPTRSQTWRTFFANHFGDRTLTSPVMFAYASGDDIVVDASDVSFCPTQLSINGSCVSARWASIAIFHTNQRFLECVSGKITFRSVQAHATARAGTRRRIHGCNAWRPATGSFDATNASARSFARREFAIGNAQSLFLRHQTVTIARRPNTSFGPRCCCLHVNRHGDQNIGDAQMATSGSGIRRGAAALRPGLPQ